MDDNLIDLGTEFEVDLCPLSNNEAEFTIEQFIAALEGTTTLTELTFSFDQYEPTPANNRRIIEPLCRCTSNLRLHNAQHPLRQLTLNGRDMDEMDFDDFEKMEGAFAQFLVAAKQFGIFHIEFKFVRCLPVEFLMEFCRDNNSLKFLQLINVSFSGGDAARPLPLNNGPPNNSVILTLDHLYLNGVSFENSTAATVFANLVAHVNVSSQVLFLGKVTARSNDDEEEDDDMQITERILSELKLPSAKWLTLDDSCRMEHFKAALDAGTTTVTSLYVDIDGGCGEDDITARLKLLASFIRRAVKFNDFTLEFYGYNGPQSCPPPLLFQALEACATVTQILVFIDDLLSLDQVRQLQKVRSRNRELDRFATNPGTYPTEELPELMRQFDNCSTGRYMLARRLPEVLSFAELHALHLSRRRTNPPTPKKSKLE